MKNCEDRIVPEEVRWIKISMNRADCKLPGEGDLITKDRHKVLDAFGLSLIKLGLKNITDSDSCKSMSRFYTGEEQHFQTLHGVQRTFVYLFRGTGNSYISIRPDKTQEEHYVGWGPVQRAKRGRRGKHPQEAPPQKNIISTQIVVLHADPKVSTVASAFLSGSLPLCEQVRIKLFEDLTKDYPLFPNTEYLTFINQFRDIGNWHLADYNTTSIFHPQEDPTQTKRVYLE